MADDFQPKTEQPTPRRREEAREQGRVTYSNELTGGLLLLIAAMTLALGAPYLGQRMLTEVRIDFGELSVRDATIEEVYQLLSTTLSRTLELLGPPLLLFFATGLFSAYGQVGGIRPNAELLALNWGRVWPWAREDLQLMSWDKVVGGLLVFVRVGLIAGLAAWSLFHLGEHLAKIGTSRMGEALRLTWDVIVDLVLKLAAGLLFLGIGDWFLKWWRLERSLMMSKQDIKDESKREGVNPLLKARIRRLQREAANKKMYREVKTATLVVTNPTHLAIVLKYEPGRMKAPRVIGKGAGFVAKRLVELARAANVPILERKPLARALFKSVKVNQEIPVTLYVAVAELLKHVYELRGRPKGMAA
jgi:flagellar biosynthesis protein FlhB